MKHADDYEVVLSDQGVPVLILPYNGAEPEKPVLLYDGSNHATLFRNDHDTLLIDFLPEKTHAYFAQSSWCVVLEKNESGDDVFRDYKVLIKKVKHNPLTDGI
ncbi:MAG: hypothetical protein MJ210_02195 [Alphaproteobacteria bacterium]|nr:hypothetical protein [Alphaproteobacteria bacterium]